MHAINRGLFFLAAAVIALGIMQNRAAADPLNPGDLVISEVMANPNEVLDTLGEWFELYNSTGSSINLAGLILSDKDTDEHIIGSVEIAPGGYLVLGNNGDNDTNGGYVADYVYSGFILANTSDEIIISQPNDPDPATQIARLDYTSGFVVAGKSRELLDVTALYDEGEFPQGDFVEATSAYGPDNLGTPGAPIPEPSTGLLVGFGLVGLSVMGRRHGLR